MVNILETVESNFSLDSLSLLDPKVPTEMADIVVGVYVINARASHVSHAFFDDIKSQLKSSGHDELPNNLQFHEDWIIHEAVRDNLVTVGRLLGRRAITATARSITDEPIHSKGLTTMIQAAGVTNQCALQPDQNDRYVLAPQHQDNTLRLFETIPNPYDTEATEWWDVSVVDNAFQPLVDLTIQSETVEPKRRSFHGFRHFSD